MIQATSLPQQQIVNSVSAAVMDYFTSTKFLSLFMMHVDRYEDCSHYRQIWVASEIRADLRKTAGCSTNEVTERKSEGEETLCFCLMKHNMSVLHGHFIQSVA